MKKKKQTGFKHHIHSKLTCLKEDYDKVKVLRTSKRLGAE